MKALLRLNFYLSGGYKNLLILAAIPFLLLLENHIVGSEPDVGFSILTVGAIGVIIGITPFSLNAVKTQSHWQTYAKTLPYHRTQIVDSHYLFSLLDAVFAAVVGSAAVSVQMLLNPALLSETPYKSSAAFSLMYAAAAAAITLHLAAFQYPLHFRQQSSIRSYVLFTALSLLLLLPYLMYLTAHMDFAGTVTVLPDTRWLPLLMLAVSAACYPLSWLMSRRAYCGANTEVNV